MDKELIDRVWRVLPAEFREEVKYEWQHTDCGTHVERVLQDLFGYDNLTSDAEGEVELLHVTRQKVMGLYANAKKLHDIYTSATCINTKESQQIDICKGVMSILDTLFGSKCLPDNVESLEHSLNQENNIDLATLNDKLDAALNSETKEYLEEWMEQDDGRNTRLQIAAQLLSGLLASGKGKHPVRRAFELTDALMEENKKR